LGKPVFEQHQSAESVELRMCKLITGANLHTVFFRTSKSNYESICA